MRNTQLGGDLTGMLLILILLMVVAGVGGLVAWKMKLFGLGGDDDSEKTGGSSSQKTDETKTRKTEDPPPNAAVPPPPVHNNCSPVIKNSMPKCSYGNVILNQGGSVLNSVTCPNNPNEYIYTTTDAAGKQVSQTMSVPLQLKCAVNTQEGHIYTHLPISISQNIGGKTFWLRTDTDKGGNYFSRTNRYCPGAKSKCFGGNTVYMKEDKFPQNQDSYLMRIIPYDKLSSIDLDPNFTKPGVVEYGKKYYLTFASPEQVLSVGPTFIEVRENPCCDKNKHLFLKAGTTGGYMSLTKIGINNNAEKIATPIMFLDANNPQTSAKKYVKIGDDVIIGFAPYKWDKYSNIVTNLKTGGPATNLTKANYHKLFSGPAPYANTQRYVALDSGSSDLQNRAYIGDYVNKMFYTWNLHNTPCRDVDTTCKPEYNNRSYHPYSQTRTASRCNKSLGFCPKDIS